MGYRFDVSFLLKVIEHGLIDQTGNNNSIRVVASSLSNEYIRKLARS